MADPSGTRPRAVRSLGPCPERYVNPCNLRPEIPFRRAAFRQSPVSPARLSPNAGTQGRGRCSRQMPPSAIPMKTLRPFLLCLLGSPVVLPAAPVESRISAATVYADRAVVTRIADVELTAGEHALAFERLPASRLAPYGACRRQRRARFWISFWTLRRCASGNSMASAIRRSAERSEEHTSELQALR